MPRPRLPGWNAVKNDAPVATNGAKPGVQAVTSGVKRGAVEVQ